MIPSHALWYPGRNKMTLMESKWTHKEDISSMKWKIPSTLHLLREPPEVCQAMISWRKKPKNFIQSRPYFYCLLVVLVASIMICTPTYILYFFAVADKMFNSELRGVRACRARRACVFSSLGADTDLSTPSRRKRISFVRDVCTHLFISSDPNYCAISTRYCGPSRLWLPNIKWYHPDFNSCQRVLFPNWRLHIVKLFSTLPVSQHWNWPLSTCFIFSWVQLHQVKIPILRM